MKNNNKRRHNKGVYIFEADGDDQDYWKGPGCD